MPRIVRRLFATTLIIAAVSSCSRGHLFPNGKSISLDREVLFSDLNGLANHIAKLDDGTLIVTGTGRTAWAIATSPTGDLLWKYVDPFNEMNSERAISQSVFHGIAPLSNGNILLYGERNGGAPWKTNLVVILDHTGHLVEQRSEISGVEKSLNMSTFESMLRVDCGLLLSGPLYRGLDFRHWIVRLDGDGKRIGESFFNYSDKIATTTVAGVSDIYSLMSEVQSTKGQAAYSDWQIYRVSPQGQIVAARQMKLAFTYEITTQLRPIEPTTNVQIITFPVGGNSRVYTLSNRLDDLAPPRDIFKIDTTKGMGYVLPDNSLALFGATGGAAIAWIDPMGQLEALHVLNSKYKSITINDAVAISATQFVTVRDGVTENPNDRGLLMDWVTLNPGL
jgi:hypothetical protein